jgi:hypothetical protein
VCFQALRVG